MTQNLKETLMQPQTDTDAAQPAEHDAPVETFDPAQQSLADALRVSFIILQVVMVLLLLAYLGSGVFSVDAQHKAVRLRFGQIVGQPGEQVYSEGWHFGLPYPIEQVIRVPVNPRSIDMGLTFMPHERQRGNQGLDPTRDGSLITGDANIVHGQFDVRYTITDPAAYVRNVGTIELADDLVRLFAEQGVVHAVAQMEADRFLRGAEVTRARQHAQNQLDLMDTGIGIETFLLRDPQPPARVASAFDAVTEAESRRSNMIEEARTEQQRILAEAAGEAALPSDTGDQGPLLSLILAYERAVQLDETTEAERLNDMLDRAFRQLAVPLSLDEPDGPTMPIGAETARVIQSAQSYRSGIVQQVRAEASRVQGLSEQFATHRQLLLDRLWQEAKGEILTGEIETIYTMPSQLYLETNRDPAVQREQEMQRLREMSEQVEGAEQQSQ